MIPLTKEERKMHHKENVCYIFKKELSTGDNNNKYHKVKTHCHYTAKYRGAAHCTCNLRYKVPKEVPMVFIMVLHIIIIL